MGRRDETRGRRHRARGRGPPFKILPDLTARIAGMPRATSGDLGRRLDLDGDRELTVEALAAEVPFRAEKLVTRDGKRVDERRETCWMAEDGIGGLARSGKVMSPAPFNRVASRSGTRSRLRRGSASTALY